MTGDQRALMLAVLADRKRLYGHMRVRLAAARLTDAIHPLAVVFSAAPKTEDAATPDVKDFGELMLVEDHCSLAKFRTFVRDLGKRDVPLPCGSIRIVVPVGLFRYNRENPDYGKALMEVVGHSGSLGNDESRLLSETRSYPNSGNRPWPTKTF